MMRDGELCGVLVFGYHPKMGGYPDPYNHLFGGSASSQEFTELLQVYDNWCSNPTMVRA